jgi:hypothetical protein
MMGTTALILFTAPAAGPHHEATWPAGQTISVTRIPFSSQTRESTETGYECTVTPQGRRGEHRSFSDGRPAAPDFTGSATITCDGPVALLTGAPRVIASYSKGPLFMVPIFAFFAGILAFFPGFTRAWAGMSTDGRVANMLARVPRRR